MINISFERSDAPAQDETRAEHEQTALFRELRDSNQLGKYWLLESPEVLETGKNVIRYYPKHGKLVVHLPDYCKRNDYSMHVGKCGGLDLDALQDEPEALHRLIEILQEIESNAS